MQTGRSACRGTPPSLETRTGNMETPHKKPLEQINNLPVYDFRSETTIKGYCFWKATNIGKSEIQPQKISVNQRPRSIFLLL